MQLVGDIGGTNARLALARDGAILPGSLRKLAGADFASFEAALAHYLDGAGHPPISALCIAVAGPVWDGQARLTNRDWQFSEAGLRAQAGAERAFLINDMIALGFASVSAGLRVIRPAAEDRARNGQALVVNAGTGFNICPVRRDGRGVTCLEAEAGHVTLPASVAAALGGMAGRFTTVEALFSGRGLAALHAHLSGARAEADAVARADTPATRASMDLATRLFGLLLRDLALNHLPREGIVLAGSVARSLAAHDAPALIDAMLEEPFMRAIPEAVPILMIEDDMAALTGCLTALNQPGQRESATVNIR